MNEIAVFGEQLIARWLELQNYELLEQNWRCRWGEIDLIAQDRATKAIAFTEVKTRSLFNWDADGLLAVDTAKQHKLIQTASLFLAQNPHLAELPCRFDVGLVSYSHYKSPRYNNPPLSQIHHLKIDQPIMIDRYQLTIKDYLEAAFD
ncbi:MAG: YraN family protein [Cyanobacteria bacterium P01_G01_bin.39]